MKKVSITEQGWSLMKKLLIAAVLVGTTTIAQAQFTGESAAELNPAVTFVSPFVTSTVADVRQMADDTYVTVEGNIIQQQGRDHEKYLFKDATGEIIVEIDRKVWRGQPITPDVKVKILGELDQSRNPERVKIEAVYLEVL